MLLSEINIQAGIDKSYRAKSHINAALAFWQVFVVLQLRRKGFSVLHARNNNYIRATVVLWEISAACPAVVLPAAFAHRADSSALGTAGVPRCPVGVLHQSHCVPTHLNPPNLKLTTKVLSQAVKNTRCEMAEKVLTHCLKIRQYKSKEK